MIIIIGVRSSAWRYGMTEKSNLPPSILTDNKPMYYTTFHVFDRRLFNSQDIVLITNSEQV